MVGGQEFANGLDLPEQEDGCCVVQSHAQLLAGQPSGKPIRARRHKAKVKGEHYEKSIRKVVSHDSRACFGDGLQPICACTNV